jgi:succinyl-CoA synthetase beta subunit
MNIHEYQAKALLRKYGVAVPQGRVAFSAQEATDAARALGGAVWVVKSQIHAGGRGAGRFTNDPDGKGGVRVVKSVEDVGANAQKMLSSVLVTKQTGPAGKEVRHRARAVSRHARRSRDLAHHDHGVHRGRHGDRGGRASLA